MNQIIVSGSFDDLRAPHVRLLEEASRRGAVQVLVWSDALAGAVKFPQAERAYFLQAIRYVQGVRVVDDPHDTGTLKPDLWITDERELCSPAPPGVRRHLVRTSEIDGFPVPPPQPPVPGRKKVVVTGCYDWLHSGHVRFCEEVSQLGDLTVCIGSDANVANLKGAGHPLFKEDERRYMVGSLRYVQQCLISTGWGWLDAEPEIARIKPDIYAVNEDGDKPEKRAFCEQHGLQYVVLKRTPKDGLTRRSSTDLRGF